VFQYPINERVGAVTNISDYGVYRVEQRQASPTLKKYVAIAFINDRLFDDKQLWVLVFHEITTVVLDLPKRLSV
jgi:hypothetical protein